MNRYSIYAKCTVAFSTDNETRPWCAVTSAISTLIGWCRVESKCTSSEFLVPYYLAIACRHVEDSGQHLVFVDKTSTACHDVSSTIGKTDHTSSCGLYSEPAFACGSIPYFGVIVVKTRNDRPIWAVCHTHYPEGAFFLSFIFHTQYMSRQRSRESCEDIIAASQTTVHGDDFHVFAKELLWWRVVVKMWSIWIERDREEGHCVISILILIIMSSSARKSAYLLHCIVLIILAFHDFP